MNIYNMKLHDRYQVNNEMYIVRVPGGWIYNFYNNNDSESSVFVPFNTEFQNSTNTPISKIGETDFDK